jgi:hypothetical protein
MVGDGAISAADMQLLFATDSVDEAVQHLEWNAINRFALRRPQPSRWLGERAPSRPRLALDAQTGAE